MKNKNLFDTMAVGTGIGVLGLLGCALILMVLMISPFVWAGLVYLLVNFVLVPWLGVTAINFWWQSVIIGLVMTALTGVVSAARK